MFDMESGFSQVNNEVGLTLQTRRLHDLVSYPLSSRCLLTQYLLLNVDLHE